MGFFNQEKPGDCRFDLKNLIKWGWGGGGGGVGFRKDISDCLNENEEEK